ncbi:MAG TPA: thioredoxin-like domain-containing protein [Candidatus Didemnitutus sp.]|nr:thioredoxin-like domain-containing protein [Candidatus Didemnitutus sp.]
MRRLIRLVMATISLTALNVAASTAMPVWHRPGGVVSPGRLIDVFGSVAFVSDGSHSFFVSVADMTDAEVRTVAQFQIDHATRPTWKSSTARVTSAIRRSLHRPNNGTLVPYNTDTEIEPQVYLIYFSAGWCPPCHVFTPELVKAYAELRQALGNRVEVIFVSRDRNRHEEDAYVREMKMAWPAIDFDLSDRISVISSYEGPGIPCLVAVTPDGSIMFNSFRGDYYDGADSVLTSFQSVAAEMDERGPAARRKRFRIEIAKREIQHAHDRCDPAPYLVGVEQRRYQTIDRTDVPIRITIDAHGSVTDTQIEAPLEAVLARQLERDCGDWLFLPAVREGRSEGATFEMHVQFHPPATTTAAP